VCVCVCRLNYTASNAHAPSCRLRPASLYNTFLLRLIKGKIFEKKIIVHKMCVLITSTTFVWYISHSKKNWAKYYQMYIGVDVKWQLLLCDFKDTWIFSIVFEKYSNIKFLENSSFGSRSVPCGQSDGQTDGQTDRHDEVKSRLRNFSNALKNMSQRETNKYNL